MADTWRPCSACKGPLELGGVFWACSVSTCNRKRTALAFCSVDCWEVHLPDANHREAWAIEKRAPKSVSDDEANTRSAAEPKRAGKRRIIRAQPAADAAPEPGPGERDVLVIASRLKSYIKARSGYDTSDRVLEPLSDRLRELADRAIENARREGRMTVLDRDIPEDG